MKRHMTSGSKKKLRKIAAGKKRLLNSLIHLGRSGDIGINDVDLAGFV